MRKFQVRGRVGGCGASSADGTVSTGKNGTCDGTVAEGPEERCERVS